MSIDTNFTSPPFTESPTRATTPEGANLFQNQAKQLFDWILDKFKVDDTDTNTFANFIKSANETVTSVNTAQEAINATVGNREIKTSWNATDDFQNKIVKHNAVLWACATTASCVNSEPTSTNADWIQLTFLQAKAPTVIFDDTESVGNGFAILANTYTPTKDCELLVEVVTNTSTTSLKSTTLHIRKDDTNVGRGWYSNKNPNSYSTYSEYSLSNVAFAEKITVTSGVSISLDLYIQGEDNVYVNRAKYSATGVASSYMKITEL